MIVHMQKLGNWRVHICGCKRQGLKVMPWVELPSLAHLRYAFILFDANAVYGTFSLFNCRSLLGVFSLQSNR